MASFDRPTDGMLRIIHSDSRPRKNRMFYNRIAKAIGRVEIPHELLSVEKFDELIYRINCLAIVDLVFIERFTYGLTTSLHVYCYNEIDLMALKLGLHDGWRG